MTSYTLSKVLGREVLDSRGNPTVEVEVSLSDGSVGTAIVPSGASTGEHEALELRDKDPKRYGGKGVLKAVHNVNDSLAKLLTGRSFDSVVTLDECMLKADGSHQKSNLGANSILGISLAFVHAVAAARKTPLYVVMNEMMGLSSKDLSLPVPLMNIINGGMHADNGLEIQEFMIVPHGFETFSEALRAGTEVFHALKKKLHDRHLSTAVGDEGGFAPKAESNTQALELVLEAVEAAGYIPRKQISLALDVAASSFYSAQNGQYKLRYQGHDVVDKEALIQFYGSLCEKFPIVSIEDGLDENDWNGWRTMTERLGKRVQLVGDDLFVTQADRVVRGIKEGVANAVLIKVNQVGSLKETFDTMRLCRESGYRAVTSHRSGETEDVSIAHLAVGSGCGQIKTGPLCRSERTAKYNELLRIESRAKASGTPIKFAKVFG